MRCDEQSGRTTGRSGAYLYERGGGMLGAVLVRGMQSGPRFTLAAAHALWGAAACGAQPGRHSCRRPRG